MSFKIGNIEIKNNVVLAPMAGVSNPAFMKICEEMGVGYVVSELISAEAVVRSNQKTFDMLNGLDKLNVPVGVQIFGSNSETLAKAAKIITNLYKNVFIDINMGCPVPKVAIKSQAGSSLLKNPDKIFEIVSAVVAAVNVPVTVKIRSGWDERSINAVLVAQCCEKAGAKAIAIHARTRAQGYSGKADWSIIKAVRESVSIPVIGNGDVTSAILARKMIDETGCDAVMIGRGVLGNPWLIKEVVEYLENGILPIEVSAKEKIEMMKKHYEILEKHKTERVAMLEIRNHVIWYLKGFTKSKEIKNAICAAKSSNEIFKIIDDYAQNFL